MRRIQISFTSVGVLRQTCMSRVELNLTIYMRYLYGTNATFRTSSILHNIEQGCNYARNLCLNDGPLTSGCPHPCIPNQSCYSCWDNAVEEFVLTGKDVPDL